MWKSLSMRQNFVAAICRTNLNWFLNSCAYRSNKISVSSLDITHAHAACVRICHKSLRQNLNQPMREHQLVCRHVKFELVYISLSIKSINVDKKNKNCHPDEDDHCTFCLDRREVISILRLFCPLLRMVCWFGARAVKYAKQGGSLP